MTTLRADRDRLQAMLEYLRKRGTTVSPGGNVYYVGNPDEQAREGFYKYLAAAVAVVEEEIRKGEKR